jgi:endonuclease/exonuclease/phosphatase family metal-dependent hydrolase
MTLEQDTARATAATPDRQPTAATPPRWRRRLAGATATAGVAWLAFVLAHLGFSGRTPLWAPLDLTPPVLFVAVPVALLAAGAAVIRYARRRTRWTLLAGPVAAGLLGAGLSGINPAALWYDPPPAPSDAITLVSWNTEFWDQDWITDGRLDADDLYRYLRSLDADVYLLHEYLHLNDAAPDIHAKAVRIDDLARLRREFPGYEIAVAGEQLTLSRFPIVARRGLEITRWLPPDLRAVPPALAAFPASYTTEALRTDIAVHGTTVSLYNAHVHQPPHEPLVYRGADREANRYNHARRVASYRALNEDVRDNPHPVVVGADLNTSPAMRMRRLLPERLVDHTRALDSVYPATWRADGTPLWRIDWLLTTPDVAVHRYEMLDPAGLSDHRAQRAVVSLSD